MKTTARTVGVVLLVAVTISTSLIVPGFVGAVTPFPLNFDNAIGIYKLSSVYLAASALLVYHASFRAQ